MDGNGWGTLSLPIREVCTRWIATAMRTSDFQNDTISHSFTLKVILRCRNSTGQVTHDWRKLVTSQESGHMTQVDPNAMDGDKLTGESKDAGEE